MFKCPQFILSYPRKISHLIRTEILLCVYILGVGDKDSLLRKFCRVHVKAYSLSFRSLLHNPRNQPLLCILILLRVLDKHFTVSMKLYFSIPFSLMLNKLYHAADLLPLRYSIF